ncbi:hypothetical protein ACROYT_G032424 [Oculina patagonica]
MALKTFFAIVILQLFTQCSGNLTEDCSVPDPIAIFPLNGHYATKEIKDRQPQGIAAGVSLADGPDGKPNGSYQFHGISGSYIEFPNNGNLGVHHSITLLCWVLFSQITSGPLFVYGDTSRLFSGMYIEDKMMCAKFAGEKLKLSTELAFNQWHYVGASYDYISGNASLWVNGSRLAQETFTANITLATKYSVRMGSRGLGSEKYNLAGRITAMQVYNFALTKEQIEAVKYAGNRAPSVNIALRCAKQRKRKFLREERVFDKVDAFFLNSLWVVIILIAITITINDITSSSNNNNSISASLNHHIIIISINDISSSNKNNNNTGNISGNYISHMVSIIIVINNISSSSSRSNIRSISYISSDNNTNNNGGSFINNIVIVITNGSFSNIIDIIGVSIVNTGINDIAQSNKKGIGKEIHLYIGQNGCHKEIFLTALRIQRHFRQNTSEFHLEEPGRQASIKVPSINFDSNGSVIVGILYKDLHELFVTNPYNGDGTEKSRRLNNILMAATMYPKPKQLQQNVVLRFRNIKIAETEEKILKIITYVGLALSIMGIILTVISYLLLSDVHQPLSQIRVSLAGSLGAGQIIFLAGINATGNTGACVTVAALMQYFLMAAFCWMLVEGIYLYLLVVQVYNIGNKMKIYHTLSWGFPAVMVAMSLSIAAAGKDGIQSFVSDEHCWISSANNLIWIFVAFVVMIEVINLLLLVRVIKEMTTMQSTGETNIQQIRLSIKACVLFLPLLGATWLFGLLSPLHKAFVYIFTILNSIQIRERFKRRVTAVFPAATDGKSAKKTSRVDQSDVDGVKIIEVQPSNASVIELK